MENKTPSRRAVVLVVVLFLLGIAIGAFGMYALGERVWGDSINYHDHNRFEKQLTYDLRLTSDQQKQLETIIDDTRAKFHALYEPLRPQRDQIRQESRDRIRAILTPEQRPKFEEFLRHLDDQHKKEEGR